MPLYHICLQKEHEERQQLLATPEGVAINELLQDINEYFMRQYKKPKRRTQKFWTAVGGVGELRTAVVDLLRKPSV